MEGSMILQRAIGFVAEYTVGLIWPELKPEQMGDAY